MSFATIISMPIVFVFTHNYDDLKRYEMGLDILWTFEIFRRCITASEMYYMPKEIVMHYVKTDFFFDTFSTIPCLMTVENIYYL